MLVDGPPDLAAHASTSARGFHFAASAARSATAARSTSSVRSSAADVLTPGRTGRRAGALSRARRPLALLAELLLEPRPRLRVLGLLHQLVAHLLPFRRTRELGYPLAELAHLVPPQVGSIGMSGRRQPTGGDRG